jgi:hypothetical protein
MNCPKCENKFRVANTASTDESSRMHVRELGNQLLNWYCQDYVVRQRACTKCMYSTVTLEVERGDFLEMLRIIVDEGLPEQLDKEIEALRASKSLKSGKR